MGSHSLLQEIFPTHGLNPGLLHCRQILYHLSHQGRPFRTYEESPPPKSKMQTVLFGVLPRAVHPGSERARLPGPHPGSLMHTERSAPGLPAVDLNSECTVTPQDGSFQGWWARFPNQTKGRSAALPWSLPAMPSASSVHLGTLALLLGSMQAPSSGLETQRPAVRPRRPSPPLSLCRQR